MAKKDSTLDIRILKYKNYVKNHPHKPYGYYCLGQLNMQINQYKLAESWFSRALSLDSNYIPAKVGIIQAFVYGKKFLKAVHYYSKYKDEINSKQIYLTRLVRGISSSWRKKEMEPSHQGFLSIIYYKYTIQALNNLFNKHIDNLAVNLILCMFYLSTNNETDKALVIYSNCVHMDGLTDNMRWALVKALSKANPDVYRNTHIAGKFCGIPSPGCPAAYANKIFEVFLRQQKLEKAKAALNSIGNPDKVISQSNMWEYINLCMEKSLYDISVYKCCKTLLKAGWVDRLIAAAVKKLKELNIVSDTSQEQKTLQLFGYLN